MVLLRPDLFRYDATQVRWCRLRLLLIVTLLGAAGWPARADWIHTSGKHKSARAVLSLLPQMRIAYTH